MQSAFEATVVGRVQLVLYRDFVERHARAFGILGVVENIEDGTVKVIAEGEKEKLLSLIELLKTGPLLARVDDVAVAWREPTAMFKSFSIQY